MRICLVAVVALAVGGAGASADALDDLDREYWAWAVAMRPLSVNNNNTPRMERPPSWLPDWSASSIAVRRRDLARFEERWKALPASSWPVSRQVDHRLLGSALARDRYDIDLLRGWQRNPMFYVDHTIGAVRDLLIPLPPFDSARADGILARFANIPRVIEQAKANLTDPRAPFARWALDHLRDIRGRLGTVARELKPLLPPPAADRLDAVVEPAVVALESYRSWLETRLPAMNGEVAVGKDAFVYYHRNVSLLPFSLDEMLAMSRQYGEALSAWEAVALTRYKDAPPAAPIADVATLVTRADRDQNGIRSFLQDKGLLTVPDWVGQFRVAAMPGYLQPIVAGSMSDLTSPSRLGKDGVYWTMPPTPNNDLYLDPRLILAHTGLPGHFFVMSLAWSSENPARRHYFDHQPNEGLAYYILELLQRMGMFDDSPRSQEALFRSMRTRPRKFEWDLQLASGAWPYEKAAAFYPHSPGIVGDPGLTSSNLMGKLLILSFLAEARSKQADKFDLRAFHDYLWKNGTLPTALLRWEHLGLRDHVDLLDRRPAPLPAQAGAGLPAGR